MDDAPTLPVLHIVGSRHREVTVVGAGDDDVSGAGVVSITQRHRCLVVVDDTGGDEVLAGETIQPGGVFVGGGDHHGFPATVDVCLPCGGDDFAGDIVGDGVDPVVVEVVAKRVGVAFA